MIRASTQTQHWVRARARPTTQEQPKSHPVCFVSSQEGSHRWLYLGHMTSDKVFEDLLWCFILQYCHVRCVCVCVHTYIHIYIQYILCCDFRAAHVEEQEKPQKNEKMKQKVRRHHTSKSDEPDLQESAFLKKIIAYQRKLLVQDSNLSSPLVFFFCFTCANSLPMQNFLVQLCAGHTLWTIKVERRAKWWSDVYVMI